MLMQKGSFMDGKMEKLDLKKKINLLVPVLALKMYLSCNKEIM